MAAQLNPVQRWLQTVLPPYLHRNQVYADVDGLLRAIPSLSPRTDTYTYDDGRTALLLTLQGTLPISFRGNAYNIPVAYWLPHDFPKQAPIVYVTPNTSMLVRPSRTVDVSGLCRGDYLDMWSRKPEGCDLLRLSESLQAVFSREPPLYAKPVNLPNQASVRPHSSSAPYPTSANGRPAPAAPLQQSVGSSSPALPAKPYTNGQRDLAQPSPGPSRNAMPARPPVPAELGHSRSPSRQSSMHAQPYQGHHSLQNQQSFSTPKGTPNQYFRQSQSSQQPYMLDRPFAASDSNHIHQQNPSDAVNASNPAPQQPYIPPRPDGFRHASKPSYASSSSTRQLSTPINILDSDDNQESNSSQASTSALPPPPRPVNPEMLNMRRALYSQLGHHISSLQAYLTNENHHLQALSGDLQQGEPAILDEMGRLEAVRDVCAATRDRMHQVVSAAERNTDDLESRKDVEVDELVCGTNLVHNQLLELVAEDNAIEDTVYHLGRAFNADTRNREELEPS